MMIIWGISNDIFVCVNELAGFFDVFFFLPVSTLNVTKYYLT